MAATVGTAISKRLFGRDAMAREIDANANSSVGPAPAMPATLSDDAATFLRRRVEAVTADGDLHALLVANAQLRGQVEDLTGALKARDMEIAALRERCGFLAKAMEQQDETIAKIYAAASLDTELPTHVEDEKKTPIADTTKKTQKPPPTEKKIQAATTSSGVLTEAIDRLLNPHTQKEKENPKTTRKTEFSRPLFAEVEEGEEDPLDETAPSSCSSTLSSKSSSTRSFERRESSTSEEDFARSAGFLRRPSRRTGSARLSISDFGLLDTADDEGDDKEHGAEQEEEDDGSVRDNQELSHSNSEDLLLLRSKRRRSSSVRSLFEDPIDATTSSKTRSNKPPPSNNTEKEEGEEEEMTYAEFLERLRQPASRDLLETVRQFVASVVGPRGDGKPPRATDFADYDFYGTHEFHRRCTRFFQGIDELLANHALWCHASEATLTKARDGIEKYVMDKLSSIAMDQLDECEHWREEDTRLMRRMQLLAFVTPDMLEIKACMRNEVVWSMAEDELRRINSFRCPGDKINCIVRCCSIIFSVLNLTRGDAGARPGADDFLPVFIYIVLHAKIPRLFANCEYIANYRNPNDLMSKAGYCFVNLRSALEFISVVDASMLKISEDEFNRLYCEQERRLEPIME